MVTSLKHNISTRVVNAIEPRIPATPHEIAEYLREAGINRAWLNEPSGYVSLRSYVDFLEIAARGVGDSTLGLRISLGSAAEALGPVAYLMLSSPTMRDGIKNFAKYIDTVQDTACTTFEEVGDTFSLGYSLGDPTIDHAVQDTEYSLGTLLQVIREYSGEKIVPLEVCMMHSRSNVPKVLSDSFGSNINFCASENRLVFNRGLLDHRSSNVAPHLAPVLQKSLESSLQERVGEVSFDVAVMRILNGPSLARGVTAREVAARLGVSQATLHRRLKRASKSFRSLVREARQERSKILLRDTHLSISDIARRLGYAETACFTRAFRNWAGMPPSSFRKSFARR